MKKIFLLCFIGISILLVGCSSAKDLSSYIDVSFTGMDSMGSASYQIDNTKLIKDIYDYDDEIDFLDEKKQEEIDAMLKSFKIKLDKTEDLSNGDKVKVTISVDENQTKKIKSGEKTVEVKGLEEPVTLTNAEVEKNLVVNFIGADGRGSAKIENIFSNSIGNIVFQIQNDGSLENGEQATIEITEELKNTLSSYGYVLENNFKPKFEVKNLEAVAKTAKEIGNYEDIERMIDESVKRNYRDMFPESNYGSKYEIVLEKIMYRQFYDQSSSDNSTFSYNNSSDNGTLIGIYSIKEYTKDAESKLQRQLTAIHGYSNIILDESNKANVAEITEITNTMDDTYSMESVVKLYEGYGYHEVQ